MQIIKALAVLVSLFILIVFSHIAGADSSAPIEIGTACASADGSYLWITSTRTLWSVENAVPAPSEIGKPQEWINYDAFLTELLAGLPQTPTPPDFAQRIASISPNYLSNNTANIFISVHRTVSRSIRNVDCENGVWTVASTTPDCDEDSSGWLPASDRPFDVTDSQAVTAKLRAVIDMLNSQPGASTDPVEGYVHLASEVQ